MSAGAAPGISPVSNYCPRYVRRYNQPVATLPTDCDAPDDGPRPRQPAYSMRALGKEKLPREFRLGPSTYRLERTVKHDFFAATGFYVEDQTGERVVLKVSRVAEFAG